ncbi:DUF6441 family protein [Limibaculum sp. FT325]|uniref:DUF6441 family protein n=1 Tax=Thermohalobaculum sediminis TaxID=2939436 RepID=UPI0020BE2580|nr:DUF6441 family protein [Limibaculum sediminis]MCL5779189.1 DUF6441 family protein [Limibaculum sediminis]
MKITADLDGDLDAWIAEELAAAERAVTSGVRAAARGLRDRWRGQIAQAGLGPRLARTIRQRDFPADEPSLRAASLVYSRAPKVVDAFDRGVTIRSQHGFFLAIPTPAAGTKGLGGKGITPGGWERRTGFRLRFVYRRRGPSLLVADDARVSKAGRALAKRGRRRRDGILKGAQTVVVFILLPQISLYKRLDLSRDTKLAENEILKFIRNAWDLS